MNDEPTPKEAKIQERIEDALKNTTGPVFLQIGSNDGLRGDPVHRIIMKNTSWKGIFVEPIPVIFEKLKKNYNFDPRFKFENVAVGKQRGRAVIYHVPEGGVDDPQQYPAWYHQIGSFDRNHIIKFLGEKSEPFIVEQSVEAVLVEDILKKHSIERVDFLHIDTEGFDFHVLSQFDFLKYKPKIVLYENKHIPVAEKQPAEDLLVKHGYSIEKFGGDTMGILR